ncbi:MAG: hypothetical protein ACYTGW_06565 [Planctomycetota bacterium]|jgi:hypothetical protein
MQDLGLRTTADLIRYAIREGLDSESLRENQAPENQVRRGGEPPVQ